MAPYVSSCFMYSMVASSARAPKWPRPSTAFHGLEEEVTLVTITCMEDRPRENKVC